MTECQSISSYIQFSNPGAPGVLAANLQIMNKVEFRLFQLVLSHVSGDRVTLALLHWDGRTLRFASSEAGLKALSSGQRAAARHVLRDVMRRVRVEARKAAKAPALDLGLSHLFRVREGLGAALYWSPVTTLQTPFPEAHFASLRQELRLLPETEKRTRRVTAKFVHRLLAELGEELREEVAEPERVRNDELVSHRQKYKSPLSWRNGVWHHAVPLSLDGLEPEQMEREVREVFGLVELAIPPGEIPVVVSVLPVGGEHTQQAKLERQLLEQGLSRRVEFIDAARCRAGNVDFGELADRVRTDIAGDH